MIAPRWFALAAGAFALALLAASFGPWFTLGGVSSDMWQALDIVDLIVAASALLAIAAALSAVFAERGGWAVAICTLSADLALVALVLLAWRAFDLPLGGDGVERASGLWIGLAAQIGVLAASVLGIGAAPRR